jgi:hypothetical protein
MKKNILPQGDRIRQLLTNGNISTNDINNFLREKGVFLGKAVKESSVPLLMKSIISPTEFNELWNTQKIKEETIKYRVATIKCTKDVELKDIFATSIDLEQKIIDAHTYQPTFTLVGRPNFYFKDNEVVFDYKVKRTNLLEDWTNSETEHKGAIHITKSNDGLIELSIKQDSTSKETVLVNNLLNTEIKKILKDNNVIKPDDDFIKIKFDDFTNESRIQFLYAFTAKISVYLDFLSITDIDLYLDENEKSHKDIEAFLNEIDSLKLNGKGLQNNILLKNKAYHTKLIFGSISFKYSFNIEGVKGNCLIDISFPDYISKKDSKAELQISYNFTINREHKKMATEAQLRKKIYGFVENVKIASYEKHKKYVLDL